jgi:hypothetical protein
MMKQTRGTIPVRIDWDLWQRVAKIAEGNRRTIRAQLELMVEESIREQPRMERRQGGAK